MNFWNTSVAYEFFTKSVDTALREAGRFNDNLASLAATWARSLSRSPSALENPNYTDRQFLVAVARGVDALRAQSGAEKGGAFERANIEAARTLENYVQANEK